MNKKEFLEKLEKKLSVLNEGERQDIITEYTDTINEKVKRGQTEEEAVKDFGDIDDLSKEILTAYKINPDFEEKEETFIDKSEDVIKNCANKIAGWSKSAADSFKSSNHEINLELIFEILIKIFIVLIAFIAFRGIFNLFSDLGESVFNDLFSPLGSILTVVWKIFLNLIYIVVCILIAVAMFKKYFGTTEESRAPTKEKVASDKMAQKEVKQPKTVKPQKPRKQGSTLGDICLLIVKILVTIYVIVPFILLDCLIVFGLIVSAVYWIKGINLAGLTILLLGLAGLFTYIIKIVFSLLFGKSKPHIIPLIVSLIMMAAGGFMFVDMVINIDYSNEMPKHAKMTNETKQFTTDKKVYIYSDNYYNHTDDLIRTVDNSFEDGKIVLNVDYNSEYQDIIISQTDNYKFKSHCNYNYDVDDYYEDEEEYYQKCNDDSVYNYIEIDSEITDGFNEFRKTYKMLIEDLKDNKVYNYNRLYATKVTIVANEKTMKMIETN